ncbi:MAG: trypsin-like peptidase domain-containing protein [Betaproteobacteria bacterium]
MLKRLWLLFAQTVTVLLAIVFILATLRPEWLPRRLGVAHTGALQHRPEAPSQAARAAPIVSYADAAQRAIPAVVNIHTVRSGRLPPGHPMTDPAARRFFGEQAPAERPPWSNLGSGVLVGADGHVLTSHHVVDSADGIMVLLADGSRERARLVGSDPETDLAVLRIERRGLPAIEFGDSDSVRVGDVVLAIGNPFGVGQTVTMGIVGAVGRSQLGINTFENFIQTDAAINPGNSGGALVDAQGRLIGINTAIYSRNGAPGSLGIGFATPISTARSVLEQIVRDGSVTRGYIGVEPQDLSPELVEAFKLARRQGALIMSVIPNGPADRGGVRAGDILVAVQGQPIHGTAAMLNAIAQLAPGSRAKLGLVRDGREIELSLTVGRRPSPVSRRD